MLQPAWPRSFPLSLLVFAPWFACKGGDAGPSKYQVDRADIPVARVLKLSGEGKASAQRAGGSARPLASGDQLFSDDALTTEGAVVAEIRIFHNRSQLLLSQAKQRKLAETAAWAAEKPASETKKPLFIDRENKDQSPKSGAPPPGADAGPPAPTSPPPPSADPDEPTEPT